MKTIARPTLQRCVRFAAPALCAAILGNPFLLAGTTSQASSEEPEYNNWLNATLGGLILTGNKAQFQQVNPTTGPVNGGIQDMHYEQTFGNKATFKIDGHALFYNGDYLVKMELSQPDVGYIRAGYTGYNTYFNGNGGYLPPTDILPNTLPGGMFFGGPEYSLYRSSLWFELGLRMPNLPELTLRYEHDIRTGQEDSTSWGPVNTGMADPAGNNSSLRNILPSFRNINETRDIFTFNAKHLIGKPEAPGNTEVNLGLRYEYDKTNDSLNWSSLSGSAGDFSPGNYAMTQADSQSANLFSGQLSTVTRFGDKLWLTFGYSYAAGNTSLGGSRIAGPAYGSQFSPAYVAASYNNILAGQYIDLGGGSTLVQNIASINLLWMPWDCLAVAPSFRFENNNTWSSSSVRGAALDPDTGLPSTSSGLLGALTRVNSSVRLNDFGESLQIRYTGLRDWVFYARGEWDTQVEYRKDSTSAGSYVASDNSTVLNLNASNNWLTQKYMVGANWYPLPQLNAAVQYYYQVQNISQNILADDPVRANQRLLCQNWYTQDANFRVTWRPLPSVSLVSRYDILKTTIKSQFRADGAPVDTLPYTAAYGLGGVINNQMVTESITWSPVDRLFIDGGLSFVLSQINSPASGRSQALQASNNNYWTGNLGAGYAIDAKTEIRGDFTYYSANNYQNNAQYGVPYNAGGWQYTFSASISRQITRNISLSLKYYFDNYHDQLSGGNNNYTAQMIATGLQMRF